MSWQAYIDQLLAAGLAQAGMLGNDGNPWAVSQGLNLHSGQGSALVALFKNPAHVFSHGIILGDVNYMGTRADERFIHGRTGSGGLCAAKTSQSVVIGVYDDKMQQHNAVKIVEDLAGYLIEKGY